ncbi:hypothetical protein [Streptomyces sp. NPDC054838]
MIFRAATRADLPVLLAGDGDAAVTEAHERAFAAIEADPRNEVLVLADGDQVLGCLQLTYVPGLGQGAGNGRWSRRYACARTGGATDWAPS